MQEVLGARKKTSPFKSKLKRKTKRGIFVLIVLAPLVLWMMIFMLGPIISVIVYSFTNAHMAYDSFDFMGLYQYNKMFNDPVFLTAIINTVKAAIIIVPSTVILSLLLAVALNTLSDKLREFYTFVYFVPSILSAVAISLVWRWLYNANYGLFNAILAFIGLPKQQFLSSSKQALACLCIIQIWAIFGYYAVILLAAIRGIDPTLFEAAQVDGANAFHKLFRITLPMIKNNMLFICIMATTTAFMFFTPVKILTDGTPGTSTMVLLLYIMNTGIKNSDIGYSSAMSLVLMIIILSFSLFQWIFSSEPANKRHKMTRIRNQNERRRV